ncbi:MAG: PIN domain-containing protein [Phycisphaerae bacterium]|nr:PIN domain-containing protein [Gemmatimonadaceae bacterium]
MSAGLDTSVVVRLLVGVPEDQCSLAWNLVQTEHDCGSPVCIADIVVTEAYFALVHHYAVPASEAVAALKRLLHDPRITAESAKTLLSDGKFKVASIHFIDALIHQHYAEARCTFVTFDKKASRMPGSRLLKG